MSTTMSLHSAKKSKRVDGAIHMKFNVSISAVNPIGFGKLNCKHEAFEFLRTVMESKYRQDLLVPTYAYVPGVPGKVTTEEFVDEFTKWILPRFIKWLKKVRVLTVTTYNEISMDAKAKIEISTAQFNYKKYSITMQEGNQTISSDDFLSEVEVEAFVRNAGLEFTKSDMYLKYN